MNTSELTRRILTKLTQTEKDDFTKQLGLHLQREPLKFLTSVGTQRELHMYETLKLTILDTTFTDNKLKAILRTIMEFHSSSAKDMNTTSSKKNKEKKSDASKVDSPSTPLLNVEDSSEALTNEKKQKKKLSKKAKLLNSDQIAIPMDIVTESRTTPSLKRKKLNSSQSRVAQENLATEDITPPNSEMVITAGKQQDKITVEQTITLETIHNSEHEPEQSGTSENLVKSRIKRKGPWVISTLGEKKHVDVRYARRAESWKEFFNSWQRRRTDLVCPEGRTLDTCVNCLSVLLTRPIEIVDGHISFVREHQIRSGLLKLAKVNVFNTSAHQLVKNQWNEPLRDSLSGKIEPSILSLKLFETGNAKFNDSQIEPLLKKLANSDHW